MLRSEVPIFKDIPDSYDLFTSGEVTLIVKKGFEWIVKNENWEKPELILSKYYTADIREGRGKAAVITSGDKRIFLKKMLHGGALSFLSGDRFRGARIVGNLKNLVALKESSIRSPEVVLVVLRRKPFFFFEGFIGEELVEGAENLIVFLRRNDLNKTRIDALRSVAASLKTFHDRGFFHGDLNAGNILVKADIETEILFIDLDKMKRFGKVGSFRRMKNIFRLFRSFRKSLGIERFSRSDEQIFLEYYCSNDAKMLSLFNKLLPLFRLSLLFHLP